MNGMVSGYFGFMSPLITLFVLFLAVLWCILPFAIFGTKRRLDQLIEEQRKTNNWLQQIAASGGSGNRKPGD